MKHASNIDPAPTWNQNSAKKLEESKGVFCPKVEVTEYQTVPNHLMLYLKAKIFFILFDKLHRAHEAHCLH